MLFAILTLSLQQAPLAEPPPLNASPIAELDRKILEAPRGWPRAAVETMASSLVGATVFMISTVALLAFSPGVVLLFYAAAGISFGSAIASQLVATIALVAGAAVAGNRRRFIAGLEEERATLLRF